MKLRRILLERFTVYKKKTVIDVPERGLVVVQGSNGSGKSSIPEAVAHALWGKSLRGKTCWLNIKDGSRAGVVLGDGTKVTRKRENNRSHVEIIRPGQGDDHDLYDTATKAQSVLDNDVGPFEVWCRSCVFSSSDASTFSAATDAERKRLLETILGLERFDPALTACRKDLVTAEAKVADKGAALHHTRSKIEGAEVRLRDATLDIAALVEPEEPTVEPRPVLEEVTSTVPDPFPQAEADKLFRQGEELDEAIERASTEHDAAKKKLAGLREKLGETRAVVRVATQAIERLKGLDGDCPTCEQTITEEHLGSVRGTYLDKLEDAEHSFETTEAAAKQAELDVETRAKIIAKLEADRRQVDKKIADARTQNVKHEQAKASAENAAAAAKQRHDQAVARWKERCDEQTRRHKQARKEYDTAKEKLGQRKFTIAAELIDFEDEADLIEEEIEHAKRAVAELKACEVALGLKGIRAHVLGKALTGIESIANYWLGQVVGPGLSLKLKPYTEKKSGSGVTDSISLEIAGAGAGEYLGASGGERRRLDVAILLAMSEVSRANAGDQTSTLFFDEVFDALDEEGIDAVARALDQIAQRQAVFVITHSGLLASQLRADVRLRVDKGVVRAS